MYLNGASFLTDLLRCKARILRHLFTANRLFDWQVWR